MNSAAREPLSSIATSRQHTMFDADLEVGRSRLTEAICGRRVLCVGAAGSIGSYTAALLAGYQPAALHLVDQNENSLAELTRQFRSNIVKLAVDDMRALPLDYGSSSMRYFLESQKSYDIVLNFAAIKHVRSEKDAYSSLQMFDTNIAKQARFLDWLKERRFEGRYFSVSTDKAANPTSMMGATKRAMEHVMFNGGLTAAGATSVTSARFANVAFSNGSLLQSFMNRLTRGEPLAAPRDTQRYFVSLEEAGQICVAAAVLAPDEAIVIPRLRPHEHLILLQTVADRFLRYHNLEPVIYDDENKARQAVEHEREAGRWPLLLTQLDTSGEKSYEEFVGEGESLIEIGLPNLLAVRYSAVGERKVRDLVGKVNSLLDPSNVTPLDKNTLKLMIADLEPHFLQTHRETGRNLDERL